MNVFSQFRSDIIKQLEDLTKAGQLPAGLDLTRVGVEPPRSNEHGDIATNAAMVLAKPAGLKPRDLALLLAERLKLVTDVVEATVAGPGFINVRLNDDVWRGCLIDVLKARLPFRPSKLAAP